MASYIDITDRKQLVTVLRPLTASTPARWGIMNAHQMIEHLVEQVEFTNGKRIAFLETPLEEAAREKKLKVNAVFAIPKSIPPALPTQRMINLRFTDLPSAITALFSEIDDFNLYFKTKGRTAIHGGFGPLNYQEWILWHGKHFAHHFKQFGLLD